MELSKIRSKTLRVTALAPVLFFFSFALGFSSTYEMTPDRAAYAKALNVSDPQAKVEALRQFITAYPKSSWVYRANYALLETLVKSFPDRPQEINKQANAILKGEHGFERIYTVNGAASTLAEANVLLPRAEQLSLENLKRLKRKTYVADIRRIAKEMKLTPSTDAELDKSYRNIHSMVQGTLGQVYVREGKTALGKEMLEAAYKEDGSNSEAAASLGMLDADEGKQEEALAYLTRARLTGDLESEQKKQLESTYLATHPGSPEGLDGYLDKQYLVLFPPLKISKYSAASPSSRTVLAELFSGSGCPPCAGADLALEGELDRYSRKELAVLLFEQHIPEPDPMANPAAINRFVFYQCAGTPALVLDGNTTELIGGGREDAQKCSSKMGALIDKALEKPADAQITLIASRSGPIITVHASTADIKGNFKDLRLQIALVENKLTYSGENGIRFHPMVVRNVASDAGFAVDPSKANDFQHTFDTSKISTELKAYLDDYQRSNNRFGPITFSREMYEIDPNDLSVVAFLQDSKTKHVLQATYQSLSR